MESVKTKRDFGIYPLPIARLLPAGKNLVVDPFAIVGKLFTDVGGLGYPNQPFFLLRIVFCRQVHVRCI